MKTAYRIVFIFALIALSGCQPTASDSAASFHALRTGTAVTDVDRRFGPSDEVSRDQLPESFRAVYEEVDGTTYRRWTCESEADSATLYAGIRAGKLTGQRLVEQVEFTTGPER